MIKRFKKMQESYFKKLAKIVNKDEELVEFIKWYYNNYIK